MVSIFIHTKDLDTGKHMDTKSFVFFLYKSRYTDLKEIRSYLSIVEYS